VCGRDFYAARPHAVLCSERCNQVATLQRRHAAQITDRYCTCGMCNIPFLANRKDARYCSAKCKQKAYRHRVTDVVTSAKPKIQEP
jgi:predicted nucleic acid-binding Zn ribbon protein